MNWRWTAVAAAAFAIFEILMGFAAYGSSTWNHDHTEVLTRWAAVREVCLIFAPAFTATIGLSATLLVAAIRWAMRGDR